MQLVFCLYKYFPHGGLQRDFLRIALACQQRGHAIRVYTLEWRGDVPAGFDVRVVPVRAISNVRRYVKFTAWVRKDMKLLPVDRVIGFNKMPGLDVYYAADPCYEEKARTLRNPLYRWSARYRHFAAYERAVFAPESSQRAAYTSAASAPPKAGKGVEILMISRLQQAFFVKHYGTPAERFHLLPPGISRDRRAPADVQEVQRIRAGFRAELGLADEMFLLVQIGSGFKTKGLDRSLKALAALPEEMRRRTRLMAIGADAPATFKRMAASLGLADQVQIVPGRDDIPRVLLGADLLVHPAYNENTGTVLLEAVVAGLPVLTTAVCGYAHYIEEAAAGRVMPEPFAQNALNEALRQMLGDAAARQAWQANALAFAETADIYDNAEVAANIILGESAHGSGPTPVTGRAGA